MANIPLTYKLDWYDPSKPGGTVSALNNNGNEATSATTQYTMQDIINTVSFSGGSIDGSGAQYALPVFTDTNTITNLPLGNAGEILTSGGAGVDPSWASAAYLPLAGGTMTGVAGVDVPSSFKWRFGTALEIYASDPVAWILAPAEDMYIQAEDNVEIYVNAGDDAVRCRSGREVDIYYAGSKKFSTSSTGTTTNGQMNITALNTAPASASATGTVGEIRFTADYIYVCVATDTWKRSALTTW